MKDVFDTIAAITTPPGKGSLSVVKLSGSKAVEIAKTCFVPRQKELAELPDRTVIYGYAVDNIDGTVIDECILLVMRGPKSYTGEDVVEFQCHGGSISSFHILKLLFRSGARQAAPGEFTLRAFLNGKKDLVQAEAVNTIVDANNEFIHKNAAMQLKGLLSERLHSFFKNIEEIYINLEAAINFPDDVNLDGTDKISERLLELDNFIKHLEDSFKDTQPLREGIKAVILGKPNVGKSTFLNKLLNYERAIVSPYPGTTRDFIEEQINFYGYPLRLIDTAGIRETEDPVEKRGINISLSKLKDAAIAFLILDATSPLGEEDTNLLKLLEGRSDIIIFVLPNKIDRGFVLRKSMFPNNFIFCPISLKTGEGFEDFVNLFRQHILKVYALENTNNISLLSPRHYHIVREIRGVIKDALSSQSDDKLLFSLKEVLRLYHQLIGKDVDPEEIDQIFSKFCIGK